MLLISLLLLELIVFGFFIFPLLLKAMKGTEMSRNNSDKFTYYADYAIIVTVFRQTDFLNDVLQSIERLKYNNYTVYIVLDNCENFRPTFQRDNFIYLQPATILADNVESHRFAIEHFVRAHDRITIIDSDNLVDPYYLSSLNKVFDQDFKAVQGARRAKKLKSDYATLDAISDIYYRYVDRKLLFEAGSSSTLSGSGMAFDANLYKKWIEDYDGDGAGFDKILQYKIVDQNYRIAFSNDVIVYDEKTVASGQLVKQRGRWINTWFKSITFSISLFRKSLKLFDRNKFLFSVILLRPPLFLMLLLTTFLLFVNLFTYPLINLLLLIGLICFGYIFLVALNSFELTVGDFKVFKKVPNFIMLQIIALTNIKRADKLSIATEHFVLKESNLSQTKILHTIRQGEVGGGEAHVLDLVQNLDKDKFDSTVLAFSYGPMVDKLRTLGIKVFVIETKTPFDVRIWTQVKDLIDLYDFDIIHAHGTRALSNSFYPAKKRKKKIIYTVHGWSFHQGQNRLVHFLRRKSERFLINQVDLTVCVSQTNRQEGVRKLGSFNSKVITNGVNQIRFNSTNEFKEVRKELGVSDDTFLIGFIGRVTMQKNPMLLLETLKEFPLDMKIKLLVVGNGDMQDVMLRRTMELKLEEKVIFMDFRNDVENILNAIDVYCLLSYWEGLSIGLLEAMSMKKPVIVSDVPGNTEVIKHLNNGMVVPMESKAVAESIIYLYNNKIELANIANNASLTVKNLFQVEEMGKKTEIIYRELVEG